MKGKLITVIDDILQHDSEGIDSMTTSATTSQVEVAETAKAVDVTSAALVKSLALPGADLLEEYLNFIYFEYLF